MVNATSQPAVPVAGKMKAYAVILKKCFGKVGRMWIGSSQLEVQVCFVGQAVAIDASV
ncbi:hypothetical protein [Methylobacter svalbardensis]|uniref:hypothetical protein n=1 Tax=Methylobacter svalbardensis TaxID=3080016 RepID=UPI0030EE9DD2